jgi:hypothetical protein
MKRIIFIIIALTFTFNLFSQSSNNKTILIEKSKILSEKRIVTNNDATPDNSGVTSIGFFAILFIGLSVFLFFVIMNYIKRQKFRKIFFQKENSNVIQYKGFWGVSENKVISADKKYNVVYNYSFNDIIENKVENDFSATLLKIGKYKKYFDFYKYFYKMLMCAKYPQFKNNILLKTICQNMPYDLLIYLWGKPGDTKDQVLKNKVKKQCFYHGVLTNRNTIKYKLRVDIEDNLIVGWKDL